MDFDLIEQLIRLVEGSQVAELEYAEGDKRVRIVKRTAGPSAAASSRLDGPAPDCGGDDEPVIAAPAARDHLVAASIGGTFFRAATPGAAPFVTSGERVKDGQTLGLIEAMKLFNPVEADRTGRITAVLASDGESVAAGAALFRIVPE